MDVAAKRWIGAQELYEDSLRLALMVLDSGFAPTLLLGLWRGGIDARAPRLRIHGIEALAVAGFDCRRVLIVDDVFDTGITLEQTLDALRALPAAHAAEIRIATVWWKPARNRTGITPHYWLHRTAQWLVFPHELCGLDASEILREKPGAAVLSQRLQPGS